MSTACHASAGRPVAHARAAHARRTRAGSTANGGTRRFTARSRRRGDVTTSDAAAASGTASSAASSASSPFERLESLLSSAAEATAPSDARGWRELEGTWVLSPPDPGADPRAVVHFCGGAFVGASPQLTYRLFLERLCARANVTIVATPFAIGFEHLRIADDAQFAFDRALRALVAEDATRYASIPTFGVGHSMGALLHSIIGARYELANSTRRCGNALMSFNNKPATDAIPAFAEAVAPGIQALSPVLSAALNNPARDFSRSAADAFVRSSAFAPGVVRELLPVLDQIEPVFMEVANGAVEFVPKPADTKALIAAHYSVPRTLLIRFQDDSIDETNEVEAALVGSQTTHSADSGDSSESSSDNSHSLDVTVLDLAGDHVRPLVPEPPELPADVATSINEAGDAIASIADAFGIREDSTDVVANPLGFLRAGFEQARAEVGKAVGGVSEGETSSGHTAAWTEADELAGEIAGWMFPETEPEDDVVGAGSVRKGPGVDTPEGRAGEAQAWIDAWRASL